jgi:hypothetical protein
MSEKKWIQKAHLKEGAFTKQAKAAGKTVQGFAAQVRAHPEKYSATTERRANLARTFRKMSAKGY